MKEEPVIRLEDLVGEFAEAHASLRVDAVSDAGAMQQVCQADLASNAGNKVNYIFPLVPGSVVKDAINPEEKETEMKERGRRQRRTAKERRIKGQEDGKRINARL